MTVNEDPALPCSGAFYFSTNAGVSWAIPPFDAGGHDAATSADGTKWIVPNEFCGDLQASYSAETGWVSSIGRQTVASSLIASSADGVRLATAGQFWSNNAGFFPTGILVSQDSGTSWQPVLPDVAISSLDLSADGLTLAAATPTNLMYLSTNLGASWSTNVISSQWPRPFISIACSADGTRLFAASDDGILLSVDAGQSWRRIHDQDSFQSIAVSADGTQLAAAATGAVVYTSTNTGITWVRSELGDSNAPLTTVAMAADGSRIYASAQNYSIYALQSAPPLPTLKIVLSPGKLCLSWPYPSAGFVLETSTNPSATVWQRVGAPVRLNLNNLQNQVSAPPPTEPTFYRLASFPLTPSTFRDLDFESAVITHNPGDLYGIVFASAFPGWVGYLGTNQSIDALFNNLALDSAAIGLQSNSSPPAWDGKYYATIESGFALGGPPYGIATSYLSQTGSVPSGAQSLTFKAQGSGYVVSLNGQPLTVVSLGGNLYGTNTLGFSGTTAELRFTVLPTPPPQPPINILYLDSIAFSANPVP